MEGKKKERRKIKTLTKWFSRLIRPFSRTPNKKKADLLQSAKLTRLGELIRHNLCSLVFCFVWWTRGFVFLSFPTIIAWKSPWRFFFVAISVHGFAFRWRRICSQLQLHPCIASIRFLPSCSSLFCCSFLSFFSLAQSHLLAFLFSLSLCQCSLLVLISFITSYFSSVLLLPMSAVAEDNKAVELSKCAQCGKSDMKLLACGRCRLISYYSKRCSHWQYQERYSHSIHVLSLHFQFSSTGWAFCMCGCLHHLFGLCGWKEVDSRCAIAWTSTTQSS